MYIFNWNILLILCVYPTKKDKKFIEKVSKKKPQRKKIFSLLFPPKNISRRSRDLKKNTIKKSTILDKQKTLKSIY